MTTTKPLAEGEYLFTSESVTEGHPDKVADQISDGVLDAILAEDPGGRVACETLVNTGLVVVSPLLWVEAPKRVRAAIVILFTLAIAAPPIRIHMCGCRRSGADESCTARDTISPVITKYRMIAAHQKNAPRKTILKSAIRMASPDVATLANSQPP